MTEVFLSKVDRQISPTVFARSRAKKYNNEDGYISSLTAWTLLENELKKRAIFPQPSDISENSSGKPNFAHLEGIHFGISHSGELVAVAISTVEVGIDIQKDRLSTSLPMSISEFSAREADIKRRGVSITQIKKPPTVTVFQTSLIYNQNLYYLSVATNPPTKIQIKQLPKSTNESVGIHL